MLWIPLDAPVSLTRSLPGHSVRGFLTSQVLHNWIHHDQGSREDFTPDALRQVAEKIAHVTNQTNESVHHLIVVDLQRIESKSHDNRGNYNQKKEFEGTWREIGDSLGKNSASLAFTSCTENIFKFINEYLQVMPHCFSCKDRDFIVFGKIAEKLSSVVDPNQLGYGSNRLATPSRINFLRTELSKSIKKFEGWEPLRSTPLDATGYLNANLLIGDPEVFPWLVLELAERLRNFDPDDNLTLVALSRNGTVLARAISRFLTNCTVDVIDHLGPVSHAVESYQHPVSSEFPARQRFVFVGDILIAGTEYRMCEAYATMCGGQFDGAVFIAAVHDSVRNLLKPPGNESPSKKIESLFNLLDLSQELQFRFPIQNYSNAGSEEVQGFTFESGHPIHILTIAWDENNLVKVFSDLDDVQNSAMKSSGKLLPQHVIPPTFNKIQENLSFDRSLPPASWVSYQVIYVSAHADTQTIFIDYAKKYGCTVESFKRAILTYIEEQSELLATHNPNSTLKVLFVNCCNSAQIAEDLKDKIHCVIGVEGFISGEPANLFCSGFFDGLRTTSNTLSSLRHAYTRAISAPQKAAFHPKAWINGIPVKFK
jgi:hypothetical protein